VFPIKFADYGIVLISSGLVANTDYIKANPDLVRRMMAASVKSVEAAVKDPKGAAQAILNANPKGGKIETLTQGFELTIPFYKDPTGESKQVFRVGDKIMQESVDLMVEYGGLEAVAKEKVKTFYTNEYLPKASGS
jgi:NitT/TauT family transport system substrate-binding protein